MRIPLTKVASCVGGRWKLTGLGIVTIVDFHPSTVCLQHGAIRWMIPLSDLCRIGEPIGRSSHASPRHPTPH